jgi:hypothetical protein
MISRQDRIDLAKQGARLITYPAVCSMVVQVVSNNDPNKGVLEKLLVFYGRVALASITAEVITKHVEGRIDQVVAWYDTHIKDDDSEKVDWDTVSNPLPDPVIYPGYEGLGES